MPDIIVKTLVLASIAGISAAGAVPVASAQTNKAARRAAIDARLKPIRDATKKLSIAPGDTQFLRQSVRIPARRLRGGLIDYEGLVTGIVAPAGVVVHRRVHEVELRKLGDKVEVTFIYAIHVDPGTASGGQVRLTLGLVERVGLANTVTKKEMVHQVLLGASDPTPEQIAADFYGYRFYRRRAERRRKALARAGLRLSMKDQDRIPALDRAPAKVAAQAFRYAQDRRLFWVAQRHLVAAIQHPNSTIRDVARAYLENLDRPRRQWEGVPSVSVLPRTPVDPPPTPAGEGVARLEPDSERPDDVRPRPRPSGGRDPERPERIEPITEYELNTERPVPPPPIPPPREPVDEAPEPAPPIPPAQAEEDPDAVYEVDTFGDQALRKLTPIPSYFRSLVLEDPNIAFGGAVRQNYGRIQTRESAETVAIFYYAQAAFTRAFGMEVTVPTQYLDITSFPGDRNPPSQYEVGNPLVALKYRFHLPEILGRRPAVTLKARWGIPLVPLHGVPATELIVEEFTREVNFADTYAFFMENHDLGLGINFAWRYGWLYTAFQLYGDLFIPVGGASQDVTFGAISYGASLGALPFGDLAGAFVEGRGTTLLLGGGRSEFFTYLGVRGKVFDMVEPAAWVAFPLGSVREASEFQIGAELRFSYDVTDVLEPRRNRRREQDILD